MQTITLDILKALCPKTESIKLQKFLDMHLKYGYIVDLKTRTRLLYFLPQISHETGCFKSIEEWEDGSRYEGSKNLGNTQKGDGKKYKGGGYIMLTGRWNYTDFQKWLNKHFPGNEWDVVSNPNIVRENYTVAYLTVPYFWTKKNLNIFADTEDSVGHPEKDPYFNYKNLTRKINGGQIGAADRLTKLKKLNQILS